MLAAQTYSIPPAVLVGIYNVEGGAVGQQVVNNNGTYDLGPMQINTIWMPELAEYWGVSATQAKKWVRDDACTNMAVSAWILRQHLNETGSLGQAIANYHSRTPHLGSKYRKKVVAAMERHGLLRPSAPRFASNTAPRATVPAKRTDDFGKPATRVAEVKTQLPEKTASSDKDRRVTFRPRGIVGIPGQDTYLAQSTPSASAPAPATGLQVIEVYNPINRDAD
jgi:hypothetical protein